MQKNSSSYPVEFYTGLFTEGSPFAAVLKKALGNESPRLLLVADDNIVKRQQGLGPAIGRYLHDNGITLAGPAILLGAGERLKNDERNAALDRLVPAMLEAKLGAGDCVVVLGGGSVLDIAGYAAAQVRGGTKVVRVPISPAALLDGAFATYAAVDSCRIKDALRVACEPAAVFLDTSLASTAMEGVWGSGFAEALRYAFVRDAALFKKLAKLAARYRTHETEALDEVVRLTITSRLKKGGTNFGLWAALRLEAMSNFKMPHGYAVPLGMCLDAGYAVARGLLEEADYQQLIATLQASGPCEFFANSRRILAQAEAILNGLDAWQLANGALALDIPTGIGKATVETSPDRELYKKSIERLVALCNEPKI